MSKSSIPEKEQISTEMRKKQKNIFPALEKTLFAC